jgi:hypothetical protein
MSAWILWVLEMEMRDLWTLGLLRQMSSKVRVSWWGEAVGGKVIVGRFGTKGEWVWEKEKGCARRGGGRI